MFDELSRRTIVWAAVLAGVLMLGYAIITRYRRSLLAPVMTDEGLLDELQAAYDAGELDEEEYRRVRETIARQSNRPQAPGLGAGRARPPRPAPQANGEGAGEAEPTQPPGVEDDA